LRRGESDDQLVHPHLNEQRKGNEHIPHSLAAVAVGWSCCSVSMFQSITLQLLYEISSRRLQGEEKVALLTVYIDSTQIIFTFCTFRSRQPPSCFFFSLYYNYISRMKALDRTTRRPDRATCDPTSYLMIGTQENPPLIAIHPCSYRGTNDDIHFFSHFSETKEIISLPRSISLTMFYLNVAPLTDLGQRNELAGTG
jgi:hypothetical protein